MISTAIQNYSLNVTYMSYLIQNFFSPSHSLKISLRVRTAFILRNLHVVFNLISNHTYAFSIPNQSYTYSYQTLFNSAQYFSRVHTVLFPDPKFLKFIPFGINFPKSAQYKALSELNMKYSGVKTDYSFPNITTNAFLYPYFSRPQIVITNVSRKPFNLALHKFLRLSLNLWFTWPRGYKINSNYTSLSKSWTLLLFLNKYFFKVYSV